MGNYTIGTGTFFSLGCFTTDFCSPKLGDSRGKSVPSVERKHVRFVLCSCVCLLVLSLSWSQQLGSYLGLSLSPSFSPSGPFPRVQQYRAVDQQTGLPGKVVGDRVPTSWEGVCLVPHGGRDNSRSTRLLRVSICHLPVQRDTCPPVLHMLPGTSPCLPTPAWHYLRGTAQLRWSPLQPPEEKLRTQYWFLEIDKLG